MTSTTQTLPAETGGTEITRFNALRHGVLSRYTVLPWESADEYQTLVAALVAEHAPHGPTEEHLVEELAVLCVKFCKGGHGWLESCGLAELDFLVLFEIVHIEIAVGFEPVLVGFDG